MKKLMFFAMFVSGICCADNHTSFGIITTFTTAQIKSTVPFDTGIVVLNSDNWDVYISTGTSLGQWRNTRTGNGL